MLQKYLFQIRQYVEMAIGPILSSYIFSTFLQNSKVKTKVLHSVTHTKIKKRNIFINCQVTHRDIGKHQHYNRDFRYL